jgi:hypothetical protein
VFASTCAALIALKRQDAPAPAFQLPGGTFIAVAGVLFSIGLLATRSSTELWILLAVIALGVLLRGFKRVRLKPDTTLPTPTEARRDI